MSLVFKEEAVYDEGRTAEVVVHAATLLIALISFEDAIEEYSMGAQIVGHTAASPQGSVVFKDAIDKLGDRTICTAGWRKNFRHHIVDGAALFGLVLGENAMTNDGGDLIIDHTGPVRRMSAS
jgi:hypothetical protein